MFLQRELDPERGAFANLAVYFDRAALILHDFQADRKPQAGPVFLCVKKRIKNMRQLFRIDSLPRVVSSPDFAISHGRKCTSFSFPARAALTWEIRCDRQKTTIFAMRFILIA